MTLEEFEKRTGYFLATEDYTVIEKVYMDFNGDKDTFCKAYKNNENGLAERIQYKINMQHINAKREAEKLKGVMDKQITELLKKIENLEKELEYELDWKPYEITDNVQQSDYEELINSSTTEHMSDIKAKDLLYTWFGFASEKVQIRHSVSVYEKNRHGVLRKIGELNRFPLYNATDWNYIRFDCGCMSYELYNGNIQLYIH